ncbi:MAG TPA: penicillin-binding transpeptidase domain-containing protein, partial [Acidimicrobiales bacterium]|nr:penicillin-binding transpeptidase domain-containing protein [Acidimicrobiales bacterium]
IESTPGAVLLSPAYRQTWFPGSSFKIVTSAAAYDHDPALTTKVYPTLAALHLPQTTQQLHNFGGEVCGGQILQNFTVSCDTAYGQMGLDLGAQNLFDEAHAFGFDQTPPLDLPGPARSNFPTASSFAQALPTLAYSAIGQEDVTATPLQMALVAAGIADKGTIMTPHILDHVTNSQNQVVSTYQPSKWLQATSPATAAQITTLMESVVNAPDGTGTAAAIPGVQVAGKTGTAQTGTGHTDDWFVAFAPAQNPTIAVSVVLPDQGSASDIQGGTLAAPIARAIIQADLAGAPANANAPATTAPTTAAPATTVPPSPAPTTPVPTSPPPATAPPITGPAPSPTSRTTPTTK